MSVALILLSTILISGCSWGAKLSQKPTTGAMQGDATSSSGGTSIYSIDNTQLLGGEKTTVSE